MASGALIACVLPLSGCLGIRETPPVIPDHRVLHQLAQDVDAVQWVQEASGAWIQQPVRIPAGWWVASPEIVDPVVPPLLGGAP